MWIKVGKCFLEVCTSVCHDREFRWSLLGLSCSLWSDRFFWFIIGFCPYFCCLSIWPMLNFLFVIYLVQTFPCHCALALSRPVEMSLLPCCHTCTSIVCCTAVIQFSSCHFCYAAFIASSSFHHCRINHSYLHCCCSITIGKLSFFRRYHVS